MTVTAPDKSRIFALTAAMRLGEALLLGFAVAILFAGMDEAQREKLETYQEISAVGDRTYFPIPEERSKPPAPALIFQGQPLVPESYEPVKIRDTRMFRVGKDDAGQYSVYASREGTGSEKGRTGGKNDKFLYIKVAPDEYLRTLPETPKK